MKTSRELVYDTLNFNNPERIPRDLWVLPWVNKNHPEELKKLKEEYSIDIIGAPGFLAEKPPVKGDPYAIGQYIDEWGCIFENKIEGIIGEVKKPVIPPEDEDWSDTSKVHIPEEMLSIDKSQINKFCRETDKFTLADICPRPFEQLQFMRGTEQLYMDLMMRPGGMFKFIEKMHDFYCRLLTEWAQTDIDGLMIMDDWGSQQNLLINPEIWIQIFKPLYKDYIDIAHKYGKKIFMHSDGYILPIIPHLIELGLDALNSQIFCMGVENLSPFAGKITFWGEMDRQHLLPRGDTEEIEKAVQLVKDTLWRSGGCIAQCEFSLGARPENVFTLFRTWNNLF